MDGNNQRLLAELQTQNAELQQQLAALRRSHHLLQAVVDGTTDAVFVKDLRGRYLMGNTAALNFVRKSIEEVLGHDDTKFFSAETAQQIMERDRRIMESGQTQTDEEVGTAAGQTRTYLSTKGPYRDEQGRVIGLIGISRDVTERKRLEQQLATSESRFQAIVERGGDAFFLMDANGTITFASPANVQNLGYSEAEFVGRNAFEFVHPDDEPPMRNLFARLLQEPGSEVHCQLQGQHRDGSWRWLDAIGRNRLSDLNLAAVVVSYRDITDRKLSEQLLRESEGRLQLLVQASNVGLWDWNLITNEVYFSPEWKRQLGYEDEELPNRFEEWESRLHADDRARTLAAANDFRAGRHDGYDVEFRLRHKNGSWRWIMTRADMLHDADGHPIRMMGCHVDVTERKQAEESLKERERNLSTLINNLPGAVVRVRNDPDYTAEYVSDQIAEITGYPADDFRENRRNFGQLMHPDDRDWVWNEIQKALGDHRPYELTYKFMDAHGRVRWNWEGGVGVFAADGELQAVECFVQDITERKQAEEQLRQSEEFNRRIVESSYDCIKVLDLDGNLLSMSEGGQRLLGITDITTYLNQCWIDFWKESDRPQVREAVAAGRAGNIGHFQAFCPSATGEPRWWDVIISAILDEAGQPRQLLSVSRDITERELANEKLLASRERLAVLSRQLIVAQEVERRRIACELHDELGQVLTAINLNLQGVKATAGAAAAEPLADSLRIVDQAIEQVRGMSLDLRPSMLDDFGLDSALRWYLSRQSERSQLPIRFTSGLDGARCSPEIETVCFRVAQEAVTNVVRHSRASRADVDLRRNGDVLELSVTDDGIGFDATAARRQAMRGGSVGLLSMEERALLAGGEFDLTSAPGRGATVHLRMPLRR